MRNLTFWIALFYLLTMASWAQHEHHMPDMEPMPGMDMPHEMMLADPLGLPSSRQGSGTAWMPDSTPMYGLMRTTGAWELMYHGAAHLMAPDMGGPRGDEKLTAPNWAMVMARRNAGTRGQWRMNGMVSLDPLTVGGSGYPLLFQTGETWDGTPLRDHQHPHNAISELSAEYTRRLSATGAGFLYLAPVGEPALGPTAYMHRTFALDDPLAPIGHHWQDASHITYGVATLGYYTKTWQLDASAFNGREPGENRFEIRKPTFDSFSGRLSVNPAPDWSLQASHGFLHSPEALHPEEDAHRTTASAIYNRPLEAGRNLQAALVWGRNSAHGQALDSALAEVQLKQDGGWTPYLRYEWIEKSGEELVLPAAYPGDDIFPLQQLTVGVVRDLPLRGDYQWGVGAQVLVHRVPDALTPVYGEHPTGWLVFLRVHPRQHLHHAM